MTDRPRVPVAAKPPRRFEVAIGELIRKDERVVVIARPSLFMVVLEPLGSLVAIAVLVGVMMLLKAAYPGFGWTGPGAVGFGLLLAGVRLGWTYLDWMNRFYVLTDRRVVRRRGVIRVDVFEARLDRIQQTNVVQPLRQRIFGLGTIAFATAGTAGFDALWEYLPSPHQVHADVVHAVDRTPPRDGTGGV